MRVDALPSPGRLSQGINLQSIMARVISGIEVTASLSGGKATAAYQLTVFLNACVAAISTFIEVVVPTVTSRIVRANDASRIFILASEGLDPKFVPAPAAFAITGVAKTISKVEIDGPYIILTVTAPFTVGQASLVAYTQPGAGSNIRDESGNLMASFAATAITNNVP